MTTVPKKQVPTNAPSGAMGTSIKAGHGYNQIIGEPFATAVVQGAPNEPGLSALQAQMLRPYVPTDEAADVVCRRPQTLRKAYAMTGSFMGVVPKKVGRRLLWSRKALMHLIEGGAA